MRTIASAYNFLIVALASLAGATIALVFILIVVDVMIRSLGVSPPAYTLAVVEYALLYITMFAAPYLVRQKGHVYIDALTSSFPTPLQRIVAKLVYLISIISALTFAYLSFMLFADAIASGIFEERGIDIPLWLLYVPMPVCFCLVAVEFTRFLVGIDTMYSDRTKTRESV